MVNVTDSIYEGIAKFLRNQNTYWSGGMGGDDWAFNASMIIYPNEITPVWYEFDTDGQNNDFSIDKLKEFYKR